MEAPSRANAILVLHAPTLDPHPFLSRLLSSSIQTTEDHVPWRIDNKYYTADVHFRLHELDGGVVPAEGIDVLIYLFEEMPPNPLPADLTRLVVKQPRDVALAIRVKSAERIADWESLEEAFDELGMEVVDEMAEADGDDERPIEPLEAVRQTLMTHMWPNMERKALGVRMARDDEVEEAEERGGSTFPVTFSGEVAKEVGGGEFPSLEEIMAQLPKEDEGEEEEDGMTTLNRLDVLGEAFGLEPDQAEYARLDDWLDSEEFAPDEDGFVQLGDDEFGEYEIPATHDDPGAGFDAGFDDDNLLDESGFDDNFTGGPASERASHATPSLSLDPTPLLLHLQSVRAELMTVEDEDERRLRAGKEVEAVMRGFGMA